MTGQRPQSVVVLILDPTGDFVLVAQGGGDQTWPVLAPEKFHFWQDVAPVNELVNRALGLDAVTLCCARIVNHAETSVTHAFYVIEPASIEWNMPCNTRWLAVQDLDSLPEYQREIVCDWLGANQNDSDASDTAA